MFQETFQWGPSFQISQKQNEYMYHHKKMAGGLQCALIIVQTETPISLSITLPLSFTFVSKKMYAKSKFL